MKRLMTSAIALALATACGVPNITWEYDQDRDGVEDRAPFDTVVHMGDLESATKFGTTVYINATAIGWGGSMAPVYVVGYGFGGEADWCSLLHPADDIVMANGDLWYGFEFPENDGVPYRITFTRAACGGPDDATNYAKLPAGDPLTWVNPPNAEGEESLSLCFSVRQVWQDGEYGQVIVPHDGTTCNNTY